ncbi:ABC transporter permease [Pseudogracilibacillus auburnensis]|uniref:ABC-2 type transport system permease protein n=1 Tax=Pseudogracilibacillus auburnensis TaxID=1494959 RepID=A0A2V3W1I6_9BACI|nr:ABC transporter permease [Pseudogracilibacillus auburnensis]PXW86968.1 ABC-2 type transport system permease protein [Pseudogracilibacillus auburnensis]
MIWEIVKKQGLTFMRNPQQLFLLIALPLILIIILSVSLSGFISGNAIEIDTNVAFIEHSDEKMQIEKFIEEVENSNISEMEKAIYKETANQYQIVHLLNKEVLQNVDSAITVEEISPENKEEALKSDQYAIVIEIPANFTYDTLRYILLDEGEAETIILYENEGAEMGVSAVKGMVHSFQEQLKLMDIAAKHQLDPTTFQIVKEQMIGEVTSIQQSEPITSKEYYTIAMAVMNVLYIATAIASFSFLEKQSQVFNRVILSDVSRWIYFIGVFLSGTIFAFIQLLIIFAFSWIIFGVTWPLGEFFVITLTIAIAVGGLAVLLTAISYRLNSEAVINFFITIFIAFLALLGGSFFPIGDLSSTFQWIGDLTPNGAGMSLYLNLLRGNDLLETINHLFYLIIITVAFIVIAVISFPKRGQIS